MYRVISRLAKLSKGNKYFSTNRSENSRKTIFDCRWHLSKYLCLAQYTTAGYIWEAVTFGPGTIVCLYSIWDIWGKFLAGK
jgi:hypothetical protein